MPLLDVSDVLSDPDFCEQITVTRSTQSAPIGGLTQTTTSTLTLTAVVQPANSRDLQRLLDAERTGGGIVVYAAGAGILQDEDQIAWQGGTYTVIGLDDWSKFGAGYVRAVAAKTDIP